MKEKFSNIAKLLLIVIFLFPEFAKVLHTHNDELKCTNESCCSTQKENDDPDKHDEGCFICKFSKYFFDIPEPLLDFSEKKCFNELVENYNQPFHKSYLLNSKQLRSPPLI